VAGRFVKAYGTAAYSIFIVPVVLAAQTLPRITVRLRREASNSPRFPFCPNAVRLSTSCQIRAETIEVDPMKKIELTDVTSNILVFSAVMVAFLPFILGDQLVLIAESAMRESAIMCNQFSTFLIKMLS
jgi:hypothetical protein